MGLDWVETGNSTGNSTGNNKSEDVLISATSLVTVESELQSVVDTAIAKGVELMARNVRDESRYFICEWNVQKALLNIVVTDESKTLESPATLQLSMPAMSQFSEQKSMELIRFWITDYLSTCSDFLRFSVIALFHTGDRSRGALL